MAAARSLLPKPAAFRAAAKSERKQKKARRRAKISDHRTILADCTARCEHGQGSWPIVQTVDILRAPALLFVYESPI